MRIRCIQRGNGTCLEYGNVPPPLFHNDLPPRILFALIAIAAFLTNLLLCVVLLKKRSMLKKPYNVLILNLAVTDMLTGIFVGLSPGFVILYQSFPAPRGIKGELYCRTSYNHLFILVFGKASNLTIMCLSIERWYAFVKPLQYKVAFTKPRMLKYLAVTWVFSILSKLYSLLDGSVRDGRCVRNSLLSLDGTRVFAFFHVLLTFGLPVIVTWVTFAHLWLRLKKSLAAEITHGGKARVRLLRMCALVALFLTLCWCPAECVFILINFHKVSPHSRARVVTSLFAMVNSCLNPWIYYLTNQEYKKEFMRLLCPWKKIQEKPTARIPVPQDSRPSESITLTPLPLRQTDARRNKELVTVAEFNATL